MGLREYLFGFESEDKAAKYLRNLGYKIIERNFKSKFGEIDIVAVKNDTIHFIEVKATKGDYESVYRVTPEKLSKILKTIDFFILKYKFDGFYQIDVITINQNNIKFLENITS